VAIAQSGELVLARKTHGCPLDKKAFDVFKIILDNFMQLPVILLGRAQIIIDNRLSIKNQAWKTLDRNQVNTQRH
jgi:hypothetical protein